MDIDTLLPWLCGVLLLLLALVWGLAAFLERKRARRQRKALARQLRNLKLAVGDAETVVELAEVATNLALEYIDEARQQVQNAENACRLDLSLHCNEGIRAAIDKGFEALTAALSVVRSTLEPGWTPSQFSDMQPTYRRYQRLSDEMFCFSTKNPRRL